MKSHEFMAAYLKLSPEDRYEFDRLYARRVTLLKICAQVRSAPSAFMASTAEFAGDRVPLLGQKYFPSRPATR